MTIEWNAGQAWAVLLPALIKVTAWLVAVLLAWLAVGRRRPAIGSAIAHAGLIGLLLVPASSLLLPALPIAILEPEPAVTQVVRAFEPALQETMDRPDLAFRRPPESPRTPVIVPTRSERLASSESALAAVPASRPPLRVNGLYAVIALNLLVILGLLSRLLGSLAGVARLRRASLPVEDLAWLDRLDRLRGELGISRGVRLAWSARLGVPVVIGWWRPMIVLPASLGSESASTDHAEAILLHELAHVKRGDYGWNLLLRVVGAIYWPHPLAWLLGRAVVESRERACDAFCVHRMGGPSAYRSALLAMAEGLTRSAQSPALGLAMARTSRLARRVRAIDRSQGEPRCVPRWSTRMVVIALALCATASLGPAKLTQRGAEAQEPKKIDPIKPPAVGKVFRLKVVAAKTGRPIPKADVRVWMGLVKGNEWRKADDQGQLEILYGTGPNDRGVTVDVWGDGFAMQRHRYGENPNEPLPEGATVKLQPGESLGGIVQDEAGRPIGGAVVYLFSHNYKHKDASELLYDLRAVTGPDGRWHTGGAPETTGEILGISIVHPDYLSDFEYAGQREKPPIAELRAAKAVSVMKKGVPIEGRVLGSDGKPAEGAMMITAPNSYDLFNGLDKFLVRTDADGRFRTWQYKSGTYSVVVRAKGSAPAIRKVKLGATTPFEEIRLEPPRSFRARVVDPQGKPIAGAFVDVDTWQGIRCLGVYLYTDEDGRVRWDDAPEGQLTLNISEPNHLDLFQVHAQAGGDLTFTLKPSLAISGIVRDAETRRGVAEAQVEYGAVDQKTGEVARWVGPPSLGWIWYSSGYLNARFAVDAELYRIRIRSEGYEPFISRAFRRGEKVVTHYDVNLEPLKPVGPSATVIKPDGKPLSGVPVFRIGGKSRARVVDARLVDDNGGRSLLTKADGTFPIPSNDETTLVLILAEDCYAVALADTLARSPRLQARPYGRVEGLYKIGANPLANRAIELRGRFLVEPGRKAGLETRHKTTTDASGRFVFEKVIPAPDLHIVANQQTGQTQRFWSTGTRVQVEDGGTTTTTIGGHGRAILGRVEVPKDLGRAIDFNDQCQVQIESNYDRLPVPLELVRGKTSLNDRAWMDWLERWNVTPESLALAANRVLITKTLEPDGSFRFDDVPPGQYRLAVSVNERSFGNRRGPFTSPFRMITIPPIPGGGMLEPLDLGSLPVRLRASFGPKVGEVVPGFEVVTVDGKKLAIPGEFGGKYLLLDFGTTWDSQSALQVTRMNDVFARFGKDERFAIVSLLMAPDSPASRKFVNDKGEPWPQAIIGELPNPIAETFGIEARESPAAILIGPDGRVVARDLVYDDIGKAIARALGIKEPAEKVEKPADRDAVDGVKSIP